MRIYEFIDAQEQITLAKLIFNGTWKALAAYNKQYAKLQQAKQQANQITSKPATPLKPKATQRIKSLAKKVVKKPKQPPYTAPPKPLPRPKPLPANSQQVQQRNQQQQKQFIKQVQQPTTQASPALKQPLPTTPKIINPKPLPLSTVDSGFNNTNKGRQQKGPANF